MAQQGIPIFKASRSHSDTPHWVGLLWTSVQPDAETSTWQNTTSKETDIHVSRGIRTHNPSKRMAADPRLRPRRHWDRSPYFFYLLTAGVEIVCFSSLDHTETHTTLGRTPLDEVSPRRRDLYLTTQTLTRDKLHAPRWDSNPWSQ
jgi:hypothetical protein